MHCGYNYEPEFGYKRKGLARLEWQTSSEIGVASDWL